MQKARGVFFLSVASDVAVCLSGFALETRRAAAAAAALVQTGLSAD